MAKLTLADIIEMQKKPVGSVVKADLSGKTVLITGANSGLGFEAAKHFASMNPARLIIVCRSQEKGEIASNAIKDSTGYRSIEIGIMDQGSFSSVVAFADKLEREGRKIDILVANAGVADPQYSTTEDGWESAIQVNHLSTALLSILLLSNLERAVSDGSTPRLAIVSSGMHYWASFDEETLSSPSVLAKLSDATYCTPEIMMHRYQDTKLLNVLFARGLASLISSSSPVIVNCLEPGYCESGLHRHTSAEARKRYDIVVAHTSEEGARQLIWAAVGGQGREEELKGAYISESNIVEPSDYVLGEQGKVIQDRIWRETIDILSKFSPRVASIVQKYRELEV